MRASKASVITLTLLSSTAMTAYAQTPWIGPLTGVVDPNGLQIGTANPLPSITSTFTPNGNFTSIPAVTTQSSNVLLPAGNVVLITNTGLFPAWVNLGSNNSVQASDNNIYVPSNSSITLGVGSNTYLAAVTNTGTTVITLAAGNGLFTGFGGGSSGGGGGGGGNVNITQVGSSAVTTGAGATSAGSQRIAVGQDITTIAGSAPGTASAPSTNVLSVQGISGMVPVQVNGSVNAIVQGTVSTIQSGAWSVLQSGTWTVTGSGGVFPVTQSGAWNIANITGTVTLPTGAATAANQTAVTGPVAAGTAATNSLLMGGAYNTSAPSLTNGQQAAVQMDSAGNTLVNVKTGTLAATQSGTWNIASITGAQTLPTGASTAANQTNASQKTQIVDGSGNIIGSTSNALDVQCENCSGSGVSSVDEAGFTAGTSLFAAGGGFYQTTPTSNPLTNGQQGFFQLTANRALFVNLRGSTGSEEGTAGAPLQVTGANGSFPTTQSGAWTVTATQATASSLNATVTGTVNALESGTWTVQPGNTPNTVAWLITGSVNAVQSGTWNINNIAGTITLPTGASTAANQTATHGPSGAGAPATNSDLIGGVYNSAAPTLTTGQQVAAQMDSSGNLLVNVKAGTVNAVQSGAFTVAQSGTWTVTGSGGVFPATQSGAWNIANITGTITLPTGAATATNQTNVIGSVAAGTAAVNSELTGGVYNSSAPSLTNGQQAAIQLDSAGNTLVNVKTGTLAVTQSGTWTFGGGPVTQSGVWNITNITGNVSLPTGASTAANQTSVIGSATGGTAATNSELTGGIYTSGAITLTTGQQTAIQLDVSGNAKVNVAAGTLAATQSGTWNVIISGTPALANGAATQAYQGYPLGAINGGAVAVYSQLAGGVYYSAGISLTNSQQAAIQLDASGNTKVNIAGGAVVGSATGGTSGTSSMLIGGIYNSTAPTLTNGQQASLQLDFSGNVNTAVPNGRNIALGGTNDTACTVYSGNCSLIALTKYVAQSVNGPIAAGTNAIGTVTATQSTAANLNMTNTPAATAPAVKGFGSLSATNTSVAVSGLTTGPNSAAWPSVPAMVYISNSSASAGLVYVCPLGGSCNTTGIQIPPGASYGFYQPATAMTVIAASTATVGAQW